METKTKEIVVSEIANRIAHDLEKTFKLIQAQFEMLVSMGDKDKAFKYFYNIYLPANSLLDKVSE